MPQKVHGFLHSLGWNEFYQTQLVQFADLMQAHHSQLQPARVIGEERGRYRLQLDETSEFKIWGEVSGRMYHLHQSRLDLPATGDWVLCQVIKSDRALIQGLFARQSCLIRRAPGSRGEQQILAANIDTGFIVTSLNADLNLRRLERYLALVWDSGAKPVILLSKSDLVASASAALAAIDSMACGVPVHAVSSQSNIGLESLGPYLQQGQTVVLIGSSGVGKSTLANALLGNETLSTGDIREDDGKGRHTTSSRYLLPLPHGGLIIDTPGLRELQLSDADEGLSAVFADIEEMRQKCRFTDCQHRSEPGCAVAKALSSGELDLGRYTSYLKLQREFEFQERKRDKSLAKEAKQNWKKITQDNRQRMKLRGR